MSLYENLFLEVFCFCGGELGEDPVGDCVAVISADADFDASEFLGPKMFDDRFESILSAGAPAVPESDLAEVHVDIV